MNEDTRESPVETGWFWLSSRYYSPELGRFIQPADVSSLTPSSINGLNLYSYANNNPINIQYNTTLANTISIGGGMVSTIGRSVGIGSTDGTRTMKKNNNSLSKASRFNLFGYELRNSAGWDTSSAIFTDWFGRTGFSSYVTHTKGRSGVLYAFAGSTSDVMNWFETTYYAGVGINLFDIIGAEVQLETVGIGAQVSIGNLSIGANINLIGGTSIIIGWDTDLGNGMTRTDGFTIEINTGSLVAAIYWIYKFVTTGDPSSVPSLQPAY